LSQNCRSLNFTQKPSIIQSQILISKMPVRHSPIHTRSNRQTVSTNNEQNERDSNFNDSSRRDNQERNEVESQEQRQNDDCGDDDLKNSRINNDRSRRESLSSNESVEIKELHEKMNIILRSLELIQQRKLEKSRRNTNQPNGRSNNTSFTLNSPTSGGTVVQSSVINNRIRESSEKNTPKVCKPDICSGDSGENANLWISSIERFLRNLFCDVIDYVIYEASDVIYFYNNFLSAVLNVFLHGF